MFETYLQKYLIISVAGLVTYFTPIQADMFLVGGLVMFDWITGVAKGIKTKAFTSSIAIRKFWVSFGYLFAIMLCRMIEIYFNNSIPIVKPMVAIIAISEVQSLRENIKELTGIDILKNIGGLFKK